MIEGLQGIILFGLEAIDTLLVVVVVAVVTLVFLRWIFFAINPFGILSYWIRRVTDPLVWPIAQMMPGNPNIAPLLLILATLIGAYFFKSISEEVLYSLIGLLGAVGAAVPLQILGWLLYGAVSVFLLLIVIRIVFSWLPFTRETRMMETLYGLTEPVMAPFRQMIPPMGMFDLSPILLMFLLSFVKSAIRSLLIQ
ncbi:MAG: YggT family protein [bacterium]|nr:YggT family protein [bacterium]